MKFSVIDSTLVLLVASVVASPTSTREDEARLNFRSVEKRASITDTSNIGYATQNGGEKTTGGAGGTTATVSSFAAMSSAATASGKYVIIVKEAISGTGEIKVASDKTIVGASGSSVTGINFTIKTSNVIVRNMKLSKVVGGDCLKITSVQIPRSDFNILVFITLKP